MTQHKHKFTYQEYLNLLIEFNDLIESDPDFNYSYSEFDEWIKEVVIPTTTA